MEVTGQLDVTAALFKYKSHRLSLNRWLGGSQNRPRYSGEKLIYPCLEKK